MTIRPSPTPKLKSLSLKRQSSGQARAERDLRERLAALAEHQRTRQQHIAAQAPDRKRLEATLGQLDAALDSTRPERVAALADDPPEHLIARIGPVPTSAAGKAVWCHHALAIETFLDRTDGRLPNGTGQNRPFDRARHQILVADRLLKASGKREVPAEWAHAAQQAGVLLDQVRRAERSRPGPRAGHSPENYPAQWIGPAMEQAQRGVSL